MLPDERSDKRIVLINAIRNSAGLVLGSQMMRGGLERSKRSLCLIWVGRLIKVVVAMEACPGAHHWGREIGKLGHVVKLIAPAYVTHSIAQVNVTHSQADKIAPAQLAIDGEVEEREISCAIGELQARAQSSDVLRLQRWFGSDDTATVPGNTRAVGSGTNFGHDKLLGWGARQQKPAAADTHSIE